MCQLEECCVAKVSDLREDIVSSLLVSPHFTIRTAMPLLLTGLADTYGFREAALGDLGSAYSGGSLLAAFAAVVWAERFWRAAVLLGILTGTMGLLTVLVGGSYPVVFSGFVLTGVGFGAAYSWMLSGLAVVANPNRTLAWQWSVGTLPGMAFLMLIPVLGPGSTGTRNTFIAILLANLLAGLAALTLPAVLPRRMAAATLARGSSSPSTAMLLAAGALFAVYGGCTGGWSLLARVAAHDGLAPTFAGFALSFATAASCIVALFIVRWGDRGGRPVFMSAGALLMILGLACVGLWPTRVGFTLGVFLFISLSAYTLTYCAGLIAQRARGASSAGISAIALGGGAIIGPAAAGHLYERWGPDVMLIAAGLTIVVGLAAYLMASRRGARHHERRTAK
jgi:predicted MFS family arabinose efflux permease